MRTARWATAVLGVALAPASGTVCDARAVWTRVQAQRWYARQPWLIGVNYVPAIAGNQLEMWQADTFDIATIDRELGWAQAMRINTVRVRIVLNKGRHGAPCRNSGVSLSN